MSRSRLSPEARSAIREALSAAPQQQRGAVVQHLMKRYEIGSNTVYRTAELGGAPRPRTPGRPEYRGWVRTAVAWSNRAPDPVPLDLALEAAIKAGELPREAAAMPLQTAQKIRRELQLTPSRKRTHRLHADFPMQAVQLDASTSEYLVVDGDDAGEGDATRLKLHTKPGPAGGYKNKPLSADRRRVVVYGVWDMCSGLTRSRYCVARGENAEDAADFLCWVLTRSAHPRVVLHGVPDELWADQGSLFKSKAARDLIERLDINLVTGEAYAKERMGGVERAHRTRWSRFERTLFLLPKGTAITLGDVNARLQEYEIQEGARRLGRTPVDGRLLPRPATWVALTNRRPVDHPLRRLPTGAFQTLAQKAERRIDVNGIVRWGGKLYESSDWHDRKVMVYQALDGTGDLVLEDMSTGERRPAKRYAPRPHGEVRTAPATPLERLRAEDQARSSGAGADVYKPDPSTGVVTMPARTAAPAAMDNPLAAVGDHCSDMNEAMRLFVSHCLEVELTARDRAIVQEHIESAGLDRRKIIDLARALRRERLSA